MKKKFSTRTKVIGMALFLIIFSRLMLAEGTSEWANEGIAFLIGMAAGSLIIAILLAIVLNRILRIILREHDDTTL